MKIPLAAFEFYVSLGPDRSYDRVAEQYGASKRAVTRHAVKQRWAERLAEVERKAREESDQNAVAILKEMDERHLKIAKALQGKALRALQILPLDKAGDVIRALDLRPGWTELARPTPPSSSSGGRRQRAC